MPAGAFGDVPDSPPPPFLLIRSYDRVRKTLSSLLITRRNSSGWGILHRSMYSSTSLQGISAGPAAV